MFEQVFIIAEAGSNHNGDLNTALQLIRRAAECGADAVKFQNFTLRSLFAPVHYERALGLRDQDWRHSVERLTMKPEWHEPLAKTAEEMGIAYFSTPFSVEAVDVLDEFVPFYKIASGDITYFTLLEKVAGKGKGVFLSTGASRIDEIEHAVGILTKQNLPFICIMHCTMLYPPPDGVMHLNFIDTLKSHFKVPVGFSDHSRDMEAALAAVSKGATAVEKHFTLDRTQSGADHGNSLDPEQFKQFTERIRRCEVMLGDPDRPIEEEESRERVYARRGIYAAHDLQAGDALAEEHVCFLRPRLGVGAEEFDRFKNGVLNTDVSRGTPLDRSMFS